MHSTNQQLLFESEKALEDDESPPGKSAQRRPTWLSPDECRFIASAFDLILPEHGGGSGHDHVDTVAFVEGRIHAHNDCMIAVQAGAQTTELTLSAAQVAEAYRGGIAAVQAYCRTKYGQAFQELPLLQRHVVLGLLERGDVNAEFQLHARLFLVMLHHASEAYFEVTQVSLRRKRAALLGWAT